MGYPLVVFESRDAEKHKLLWKRFTESKAVIETVQELYTVLHMCNSAGIVPIFIVGMNRSERSGVPANYTLILLVPTAFGVIKFVVMIDELGFKRKTWAYPSDPLENSRYVYVKLNNGKECNLDCFKFTVVNTFGKYY